MIARIIKIDYAPLPGTDGADDDAWHQQVRLVLAPHPELAPTGKRAIELDYGMQDGEVTLECRQALLFYALKRLGLLDAKPGPSNVQQMVLRNREDIARFLPRNADLR